MLVVSATLNVVLKFGVEVVLTSSSATTSVVTFSSISSCFVASTINVMTRVVKVASVSRVGIMCQV